MNLSKFEKQNLFGLGKSTDEIRPGNFIGKAYINLLSEQMKILNVTFEPGCRNNWHIHHVGGQVLLITAGHGWSQVWGELPRELHPGDIVEIPPEVKHWHGAASDSWMSHLAIEVPAPGGSIEWLEAIDATAYRNLAAREDS